MGNIEADDGGLWARSLDGEGEAFGLLYDRHHGRVYRHAYRLSPERHDAEDIMSAAFLELWRCRAKVRLVDGSILPWLLVTTTNVARNNRRAAFRYRKLLASLPRTEDLAGTNDELFLQGELDSDTARALATLNAVDQQLVSLVVFEDYTIAAAATVLNLSPAAAKSRMHRARERMKTALAGTPKLAPAFEGDQR
ncbi:RNA polymerase sigma-70 factor (ECF subfamily) [Paenarthrobacter nitroguajacolicus]|uniref:RNA polymerase sigma factor n=1 Tax=Paenarthrobacter TaxID=1742992 RepID=UPI0028650075|nr:sigma-70 family RNA polymerase sigma factor [Paenarthrobacter nitroguajacolicus]MDR6986812.1 RNA polymerase sigma-70 factor (ECF subfamily) [Paenarthrobacter nitroguajacolicus]